jgi:beta-phosphoglucomutase family hydrolase
MLGLPDHVTAVLFDLDGVLTDTASVHFAAWKKTFDAVLEARGQRAFTEADYDEFVDGKLREDGVRSLLDSRGIAVPDGPSDADGLDTVNGIANAKNATVLDLIKTGGVTVYPGSRRYLEQASAAGLRRAVVSSSANAAAVLAVTGLDRHVEQLVDGTTIATEHLRGKPAPDSFLAAAQRLDVEPAHAAVVEDAVAGVAAGKAGRFGYVVGVNRLDEHHGTELAADGADVVVADLGELL